MLRQSVDWLVTRKDGIYVDGTLGGGGHAAEIIGRLESGGKLIAFDKDEEAIKHSRVKLLGGKKDANLPEVVLMNDSYDKACSIKESGGIDGILLDLGLSSHQLDTAERGFSFKQEAPIDMRFGRQGESAEELLNSNSTEQLEDIFRKFGEEPFAKGIARRIDEVRRAAPIKTTLELTDAIASVVPQRFLNKTLYRIYQAIRIAVNNELEILEFTMNNLDKVLAPGGRIVVISYHSLEDRIVKSIFRKKSRPQRTDDITGQAIDVPKLKILVKKPITPDEAEIESNPRSRSAKLRVAERI